MYYVYILLLKNGQLYTGYTRDLKQRLRDHKYGKVASTAKRRPHKLVHYEAYSEKSDAKRRELFLKKSEGKKLLKRQIKDFLKKNELNIPER